MKFTNEGDAGPTFSELVVEGRQLTLRWFLYWQSPKEVCDTLTPLEARRFSAQLRRRESGQVRAWSWASYTGDILCSIHHAAADGHTVVVKDPEVLARLARALDFDNDDPEGR